MSTDFGLHRQTQIVGEVRDLGVLHARVRLELEGRDDGTGMDLHDAALDGELAALLLEEPGAVHELALVDLALGLRRVEKRERRQRVVALAALGRRLRRLGIGKGKRRRRHVDLRRLRRRERPGGAEARRRADAARSSSSSSVALTASASSLWRVRHPPFPSSCVSQSPRGAVSRAGDPPAIRGTRRGPARRARRRSRRRSPRRSGRTRTAST